MNTNENVETDMATSGEDVDMAEVIPVAEAVVAREEVVPPRPDKGKTKEIVGGSNKVLDMSSLPWVEKYRPATLDDVVAHQDIISTSSSLHRDLTPQR